MAIDPEGHTAWVKGYGSREMLTELRGRVPVFATLTRAWVTTPTTARDLITVAESRGYLVTVLDKDPGVGQW